MVSMVSLYMKTYKKMFYLCFYHVWYQSYDKNEFFMFRWRPFWICQVDGLTVENTAGQTSYIDLEHINTSKKGVCQP